MFLFEWKFKNRCLPYLNFTIRIAPYGEYKADVM